MANAINRWQPGTGLSLRDAMNQLFEESFVRPFGRAVSSTGANYLPLDIFETDEAFVVKAFVPGVAPDQIDITTQQNTVTIRAEQPVEQQEGVHYHLRERLGGTWLRSFKVPVAIDAGRIDAQMRNGVLSLRLPKAPEAKAKKVQIKSS